MLSQNRNWTNLLKYIAAILVVNGHIFLFYSNFPSISRWTNLGSQCVSLFLFFSAYGLMYAYHMRGKSYLKNFFSRRILKIIIPWVVAYAISLGVYSMFHDHIDWNDVIQTIGWGGNYMQFSWYVTEIAVLYLLFYVSAKISRNDFQLSCLLTILVVVMMSVLLLQKSPLWYMLGLPCFIFGIWYQRYEQYIENVLCVLIRNKFQAISIAVCLLMLFVLLYQWYYIRLYISFLSAYRYEYIAMYSSNIIFTILVIYLSIYLFMQRNQ